MTFNEENVEGIIVLAIGGKINTEASESFSKKMTSLIENGARQMLLDLSGVDYINSSGLRALLAAAKKMADLGGKMALADVAELIYRVLEVSGCTSHIRVYHSREEALKSLKV
ncbi:MAG: anti-sigma factor antagonist [Acidobacteria bacterium]|nr:MAG: anti-sigma factor antagonist [Acidobacteriota bacterium]